MTANQLIANQRKCLLLFAQRRGNIAEACRVFGVSRTTYYQIKNQLLTHGTLEPLPRPQPVMPNRTRLAAKKVLLKMVSENPSWGPQRYSFHLKRRGVQLSPTGVYYHLRRYGLNTRWKRLIYLEQLNARNGILTQRTLRKLQQKRRYRIKAEWPGDLVGIDTFYIGYLKGVGRVYQLTAVDCFSRFGAARLYTDIGHKPTVDFVEYHLIPQFFRHRVRIERILSDRGSEFCNHWFNTMLSHYEIEHVLTKPRRPQSNGITERFQRTILEEFYQKMFRTKLYQDLDGLQEDLDQYLIEYNFFRPHQGIKGKYPIELLKPSTQVLQQRFSSCKLDS